jgi:hypothetical protein
MVMVFPAAMGESPTVMFAHVAPSHAVIFGPDSIVKFAAPAGTARDARKKIHSSAGKMRVRFIMICTYLFRSCLPHPFITRCSNGDQQEAGRKDHRHVIFQ